MPSRTCCIPLTVHLHGLPDEERLAQMASEVAFSLAEVMGRAERAVALLEGGAGWRKVYLRPEVRLRGRQLDPALARRIELELRTAVMRALAPALGDPVGEGVRAGHPPRDGQVFWDALRSQLLVSADGSGGHAAREQAVALLIDAIGQSPAQLLIHEALLHESPGLRVAMMEALGRVTRHAAIAWKLMLRGLVRHGDTLGLGWFSDWLDRDPRALLAFLAAHLDGGELDRGRAAQVVLHYLEGQYQPARAGHRDTFYQLRRLAHAHSLFGSGPHGLEALRERVLVNLRWLQALAPSAPPADWVEALDGARLEELDAEVLRALAALATAADPRTAALSQALCERADTVAGLLEAGHRAVRRYDPAHRPRAMDALVAACRALSPAGTHHGDGTLVVRADTDGPLLLFVGPGPVAAP